MDGGKSRISDAAVALVGGSAVGIVAMFGMLWLVFGEARTAAIVVVVGLFTFGTISTGMALMYFATRHTIEHMAEVLKSRPPEVIESTARPSTQYEPRNDLQSVDNQLMVRQDQIARTAIDVYRTLYPLRQPTRTNIQAQFPQLRSNGFVAAVQEYLKGKGLAVGGGQGREYQWFTGSDTDVYE